VTVAAAGEQQNGVAGWEGFGGIKQGGTFGEDERRNREEASVSDGGEDGRKVKVRAVARGAAEVAVGALEDVCLDIGDRACVDGGRGAEGLAPDDDGSKSAALNKEADGGLDIEAGRVAEVIELAGGIAVSAKGDKQ
jgi:hypothetical protein